VKELEKERLIENVAIDGHVMQFQLTQREKVSGEDGEIELSYSKETMLYLDTTTGKIHSKNSKLREQAQQLLDKHTITKTGADITLVVRRLFALEATKIGPGEIGLIQIEHGVYFVSVQYGEFIRKVDAFLQKLGGKVTRFPIPIGDKETDHAVAGAVEASIRGLITEHLEAVENFNVYTTANSLHNMAERINTTRIQLEAHATYLADRKAELEKVVEEANAKLAEKIASLNEERKELPETAQKNQRVVIFGYAVTVMIRWMARKGWSFKTIRHALSSCEVSATDNTIKTQMSRIHSFNDEIALSEEQVTFLENLAKSVEE
jgi:hypothetical protein